MKMHSVYSEHCYKTTHVVGRQGNAKWSTQVRNHWVITKPQHLMYRLQLILRFIFFTEAKYLLDFGCKNNSKNHNNHIYPKRSTLKKCVRRGGCYLLAVYCFWQRFVDPLINLFSNKLAIRTGIWFDPNQVRPGLRSRQRRTASLYQKMFINGSTKRCRKQYTASR